MKSTTIELERDQPYLPTQMLVAGKITAMYEGGRMRHIKYDGNEIIRMIYPALRDEYWNTILPNIDNEIIKTTDEGFSVVYTIAYEVPGIHYRAYIEITGSSDGIIEFAMKGESWSDFKSKRVGLCVHHPITTCAGQSVEIDHPEGKMSTEVFPALISPVSPFTDIQIMRWTSTNNDFVQLDFEGDLFETEDQRNWTDDSYKTYSGPQHRVAMLDIHAGDKMEHRITIKAKKGKAKIKRSIAGETETKLPFPAIGYKRGINQKPLNSKEIGLFKDIVFDHYRTDLNIGHKEWKEILKMAVEEAAALNVNLDLAIIFPFTPEPEFAELLGELKNVQASVGSILILAKGHPVCPADFFKTAAKAFREAIPGIQIGYGTEDWFADLNNNMPGDMAYDFVSYSLHPQIHQSDNRSILENLGSQQTTIATIRSKLANTSIHPYISFSGAPQDPRLYSSFAAWWTINTISNLSESGHLTLYELTGERGLVWKNAESSPVYQLLKTIKQFGPKYIIKRSGAAENAGDSEGEDVVLENASGGRMNIILKDAG